MYSVYQHWDPLRVCIVGRSYSPKFYDYIENSKVKKIFYKIAEETEEDYQELIKLLQKFNVKVLRPDVTDDYKDYIQDNRISPPPMTPRDHTAMIGNKFFSDMTSIHKKWNSLKGENWPACPDRLSDVPRWIIDECENNFNYTFQVNDWSYKNVLDHLENHSELIYGEGINSAMISRIGKDLYFGTMSPSYTINSMYDKSKKYFSDYRCHIVETENSHTDGCFCPVVPGLIVSLMEMPAYETTFPNWEVVYLENNSWSQILGFAALKEKNQGKWWVPGEELNADFTDYVETWMTHWVGYVEETVFDVNMLVIDKKNVVCNGYNQKVFDAFSRFGITAHIINFRHRYFWDGGLHCITSDVHREGSIQDYFPERS